MKLPQDELSRQALEKYLKQEHGLSARRHRSLKETLDNLFQNKPIVKWKSFMDFIEITMKGR